LIVVVLSPNALPAIRMTVDEYLAADLPEGYRYELVEGVVQMAPIPGLPHDSVVDRLHYLLTLYRERRPDIIAHVSQRFAVTLLDRQTAREPDFGLYGPSELGDKKGKTWKNVTPFLVVEVVSPGQADRDYEEKRRDYWDARVGEYWIADPEDKSLTVLTRGASEWIKARFEVGQSYRPAQLPGLEIRVDELFA
jgi:Uma2 family endonuclease